MQPKSLILLVAALQSASVFAAPVSKDASAVVFNGPGYYKTYRTAADAGLVEKEKREAEDAKVVEKRGVGAPVEFQAASYRPLYREAAEAYGEKEKRQTEFRGAAYVRLYREAKDAGLVKE